MNFHRQLHTQFKSSTPAKRKKRIEASGGVGPGRESLILKSAKDFRFSIFREFSHKIVCIPGSGGFVSLI
jgi:hypothetical protein